MRRNLRAMSDQSNVSRKNTISSSRPNVPQTFELLNHTIEVGYSPALDYAGEYGSAHYAQNQICLGTDDKISPTVYHHTFCHELVHFLFHYAGRDDLAEDEVLVDTVGGLLAQYESTKRP